MKKKTFVILFVVVTVFSYFQDWLWVQFGWQQPPSEPLTGPQVEEIHRKMRDLKLEPLVLTEVRFVKNDSDDPIDDYVLEFVFNRKLTPEELADYGYVNGIWQYSLHFYGIDGLGAPLYTLDILSSANDGPVAVIDEYESSLHPRADPKGSRRTYRRSVDEAFQPGELNAFALRLYRRTSILSPFYGEDLDFISEWRSEDLKEIEPGRWIVPDGFDSTPSASAREEVRGMNKPRPH